MHEKKTSLVALVDYEEKDDDEQARLTSVEEQPGDSRQAQPLTRRRRHDAIR